MTLSSPLHTVAYTNRRPQPAPALSGLATTDGWCAELPDTALFALVALLETRIRTLMCDNRALHRQLRQLTVALDDCLDRESAHALCPHHERLVLSQTGSPRAMTNRALSRCNGLTAPFPIATRSEVHPCP